MLGALERDYDAMAGMIMGQVPAFNQIIDAIAVLEDRLRDIA